GRGDDTGELTTASLVGGWHAVGRVPYGSNLAGSRAYTGLTAVEASAFVDGDNKVLGVNGETLTLAGSGTAASKDVGDDWTVTSRAQARGVGTGAGTRGRPGRGRRTGQGPR